MMTQKRTLLMVAALLIETLAFHQFPLSSRKSWRNTKLFVQETSSEHPTTRTLSNAIIKRWPQPVVESNGDYLNEKFLEDHIGGPLYSSQNSLPFLPVPSISQSLNLFLPTALPLAESKQQQQDLIKACEAFPKEADELQKRLEAKAAALGESSWLQNWWNKKYLQLRDPIVINVSFFCPLEDDETLPDINDAPTQSKAAMRGACALTAIANYRKKVCSGQLPVDVFGHKKKSLCSTGFKYHLHSCRIPMKHQDSFRIYDPFLHKHCVVACRGQFFAMDLVDEKDNPLHFHAIEKGLERCAKLAKEKPMLQFGFLTTSERDAWAKNRELLVQVGGENMVKALETIESSVALICLDETNPSTLNECAPIYWHGGYGPTMNRWFDKPVQILCQSNGRAAYFAEHSMIDGMLTDRLCDDIVHSKYAILSGRQAETTDVPFIENIFENTIDLVLASEEISDAIEKAKDDFYHLVGNQEISIKVFQGYGLHYLKRNSLNTDAYVQMALQLATYRLFGKQVATYEASQVRFFLHGRTETTRTVSPDSHNFIKRMGRQPEKNASPQACQDKYSLLKKAMWTHCKYLSSASKGFGCDRHFLGLSMLIENGEDSPTLFSNPLFKISQYWRVSSSTLPHTPPGFGCVVDDGVGIGYHVDQYSIECILSSRKNGLHWTETLGDLIEEALLELMMLVDTSQ